MSENNPFAAPENNNSQQPSQFGNYTDPAAQYSAQANSEYSQSSNTSAYGQQDPNQYAQQSPAYGQQPPAYGAPAYGGPGYAQANSFDQASLAQMQGQKDAQTSMIMGIIGLFVAGIVLGPLGLHYAKKAERAQVSATAGKVLGWINIIIAILTIIAIIFFILITIGLVNEGITSDMTTELNNL